MEEEERVKLVLDVSEDVVQLLLDHISTYEEGKVVVEIITTEGEER